MYIQLLQTATEGDIGHFTPARRVLADRQGDAMDIHATKPSLSIYLARLDKSGESSLGVATFDLCKKMKLSSLVQYIWLAYYGTSG